MFVYVAEISYFCDMNYYDDIFEEAIQDAQQQTVEVEKLSPYKVQYPNVLSLHSHVCNCTFVENLVLRMFRMLPNIEYFWGNRMKVERVNVTKDAFSAQKYRDFYRIVKAEPNFDNYTKIIFIAFEFKPYSYYSIKVLVELLESLHAELNIDYLINGHHLPRYDSWTNHVELFDHQYISEYNKFKALADAHWHLSLSKATWADVIEKKIAQHMCNDCFVRRLDCNYIGEVQTLNNVHYRKSTAFLFKDGAYEYVLNKSADIKVESYVNNSDYFTFPNSERTSVFVHNNDTLVLTMLVTSYELHALKWQALTFDLKPAFIAHEAIRSSIDQLFGPNQTLFDDIVTQLRLCT